MEPRVGNKFRLGRKIGSGSFGEIYLGFFVFSPLWFCLIFQRIFVICVCCYYSWWWAWFFFFVFVFWFYIAGTNIQTNEEVAIKLVSDVDHLCLRSYSNLSNLFVLFFVASFVCWSLKSCMNDLFGNWFGKGGFILLSQFLELVVKLVSGCVFVLVLLMSFIGVCCCFYSWCICLFDCVFTELLVVVVFFFSIFLGRWQGCHFADQYLKPSISKTGNRMNRMFLLKPFWCEWGFCCYAVVRND